MKIDTTRIEQRLRIERRSELNAYLADQLDRRNGTDRRSPLEIEADNAFVNRKAAEFFAAANPA